MLASILRLIAVRPLLSLMIFGFPVILLVMVGLVTIWALKFFVFIVLPIVVVIWVLRKVFGSSSSTDTPPPSAS